MATINRATALQVLKSRNSSFVSFRTITEQTTFNKGRGEKSMLAVTGIDPTKIVKITSLTALCGKAVDYETLVQNRELKSVEGLKKPTFEAEARKWGTRIDGVEVQHNGKQYVTLHCVANNKPKVEHLYEGKPFDINDSKFDQWRKEKEEGARQMASGVSEHNVVVYRDYSLDSIQAFTVDKEVYQIEA